MLLLGVILLVVGALLVLAGVFTAEVSGSDVEILGIGLTPTGLFLVGLAAGACLLLGLSVARFGARRELRKRKERKHLDELAEKLDHAEAERRRDLDEDRP